MKPASIKRNLNLFIERASKKYLETHLELYNKKLNDVITSWKSQVYKLLSVKYKNGSLNLSLYPKMRSGELRKSISKPKVKYSKIHKSNGKYKVKLTISTGYRPLYGSDSVQDYGEYLNSLSDKTFGRWKIRLNNELIARVHKRLRTN